MGSRVGQNDAVQGVSSPLGIAGYEQMYLIGAEDEQVAVLCRMAS
jgi:hypothetical protein